MEDWRIKLKRRPSPLLTICLMLVMGLLLWKPSNADTCSATPYQVPGHVLVYHVIQSYKGTCSSDSCLDKCAGNSSCHSINWYSKTGLCQINRGSHLSYPEGLVADSTGSYVLYSLHPMVTCSNKYCSHPEICLMEGDGINYWCQACGSPLGMQDGRIKDSQITASSSFSPFDVPNRGRLHSTLPNGCWAAARHGIGEYLQIDLAKMHIISKVATQGRGIGFSYQWVTKYYLKYSQDGVNWETYKYGGNVKEFQGNTNRKTVVTNQLPIPLAARFIRFVALAWHGHISMRVELYGCTIE